MPEGFEKIPDWFSFENQGAGVAVTDFGGGQQHLVVLMVDNPPQQNRGLYRIGRNLDAGGRVTGGWTQWFDVPDWFSWENQGADIAVADLGGGGDRDLIVFMIDNPPQKNQGKYRIGKKLDVNGNIAQWTPWIDVPNWFSWENQGGGIAVTPPDGQGQRNLVVFMIDNPPGKNQGFYRVGKGLDANGNVTGGWTDWIEVPDWFSFENQGGSITVADLDGNGSHDLVVFMIDNVKVAGLGTGENLGCYKVGRKLDANGGVAKNNWDKNWFTLPYWFSWENQGGGIDVAPLQGQKTLFTLIVDNPPGKNKGFYQAVDIDTDPATVGRWDRVFQLKNVAIHASVLPNGKVLFWGRRIDPNGTLDPHECMPWIWDPETGQQTDTPQPRLQNNQRVNLFCAGHAFMPDGELLVAGGHIRDSVGSPQASLYDYRSNSWKSLPQMNNGRWYPTVTALSDGRMLVSSGSYLEKDGTTPPNPISQIWDGARWMSTVSFFGLPLYPRMHVAPDGRVFMSGSNAQTYFLDLSRNMWTRLPAPGGARINKERQYAPSVMYDTGKIIYLGGGNDRDLITPTANAEVIDLGANPPAWEDKDTPRMHFRRRQHNATLLPDGTILVTGGTSGDGFNNLDPGRPIHVAELWDPKTKKWTMLVAEDIDRCYHSTAVLLPDATVLSAGGGEYNVNGPNLPPQANRAEDSHRNAQIFRPPYLFRSPRPRITDAPEEIDYGKEFTVRVSGPEVDQVTWLRLSSVTHAFNQNQFIHFLEFRSGSGGLTMKAPARSELCPPGHYMLFVLSKDDVPSVARIRTDRRPCTAAESCTYCGACRGGIAARARRQDGDRAARRNGLSAVHGHAGQHRADCKMSLWPRRMLGRGV